MTIPNRFGYSFCMEITLNGRRVAVRDSLSCGPGEVPHAYELVGGAYVYEIAGRWYLAGREVQVTR